MLLVTTVVVAAACGHNGSPRSQATSTSTVASNTVSFSGVQIVVPDGWTVVQASSITTCPPTTNKVVVVGDLPHTAVGDCLATLPNDEQIYLGSEPPGTEAPTSLMSIGALRGWQQVEDNGNVVVTFPDQKVVLSLDGNLGDVRQQVLNSVKPH